MIDRLPDVLKARVVALQLLAVGVGFVVVWVRLALSSGKLRSLAKPLRPGLLV